MHTFTDTKNRDWSLEVTAGSYAKFQAKNIHFFEGERFVLAQLLSQDMSKFLDMLWILVEKQASEKSVTRDEFNDALIGDTITNATLALLRAVSDFFPNRNLRELSRNSLDQAERLQQTVDRKLAEAISKGQTEEDFEKEFEANLDRALGIESSSSSVGNVQESSESIPEG